MYQAKVQLTQRTAYGADHTGQTPVWVVPSQEPFAENTGAVEYRVGGRKPKGALAKITIVHPAILWGTPDELRADFVSFARKHLKEAGLIVANDAGIEFWRGEQ